MISWQAGVKGEAGERGEARVRPSPGIITGTWLVVVAGDVPSWKTKELLLEIHIYFSSYLDPPIAIVTCSNY